MKRALAVGLLWAVWAQGAPSHIVIFKRAESLVTAMDHQAFQNHLMSANQKSVTQLQEWMGSRGYRTPVGDLWLAQGALVNLDAADAKKLAKEPWVNGVYENRVRKFIHTGKIQVGNTLDEVTTEPGNVWGLGRIGVDKIRAEFPQVTGQGVRVGVLDTGIQSRHPELKGISVKFKDFVAGLPGAYDDHGHGTHVTGTIGGAQVGIAPGISVINAKIFGAAGSGRDSEILSAMQWIFDPDGNPATDDHPHIISNSWGADITGMDIADMADFAPFHQAVLGWIKGGVIPVFAGGNSGMTPNGMPGGFPEVIAVGAFDSSDVIADFSSRGPNVWKLGDVLLTVLKPDVSAPGVAVASAFPGNKYASWAGTSMATPHVAGALALALQVNPKLRLADAKALLLKSCEKKTDNQFGYGILNAYELVKLAMARQFH